MVNKIIECNYIRSRGYEHNVTLEVMLRTRLNVSRSHVMLPRHSMEMGFCTYMITDGRIRRIFTGNKYHLNCLNISSNSSHLLTMRWLNSQMTNTEPNAYVARNAVVNSSIELISSCAYQIKAENVHKMNILRID